MTTTLNQIRSHHPCADGYAKLLKHLNKTSADDEPLSLLTILEFNGLNDAIWCLRTEQTPERIRRFALAVSRTVEHLSPAAKACNDVTERYLSGTATKAELGAAARAAARAAAYAANAANAAANAANAAAKAANAAAYAAANAAANAAVHVANSAANAAHAATHAAVHAATHAAVHAAADAAEREAQTQIFKEIFV
jgi:hypothetical protein